jgi:hypothetical protein
MSREAVERKERIRERDRRYQQSRYAKIKRDRIPNSERPFIFWDGEGPKDAGYALFGNSAGAEICHPFLSTTECLDLLLASGRANPNAVHIAFGFNYDASMILADLPWRNLKALHVYGATIWHGYEIEHIPHKWFKVKKDGIIIQVFDIRSFFAGSYVSALMSLDIGGKEVRAIAADKQRRSEFVWRDIASIRRYWKLELKYGPILAEKLRKLFLDAGFDLRSWHGPGALARLAMAKHHVFDAMAPSPPEVLIAARYAFAGGRFEMPRGGHIEGTIHNADLRSAYPAYARFLPNLSRGRWRRGRNFEPGKFGIYHISYDSPERNPLFIHPLFRRQRNGVVDWPSRVQGWYHAPEAELVSVDSNATFLEAWIFDEEDETDRPFAWIEDYFNIRANLKRMGNPLELTFKLIINSIYGQLAQRTGWDRKKRTPPKSHQLEWAGYITSACRAAVYRAAKDAGDKLISIDTDGIYSMAPVNVVPGTRLGEWEVEEFDEGIFWQSGIYALRKELGYDAALGYGWVKGKTRGIPKGSYSPETLLRALLHGKPLSLSVRVFIGYGLALGDRFRELNTWRDEERTVTFGGQGKRYHNDKFYCKKHCPAPIHNFIPPPQIGSDYHSLPHFLPWLKNDPFITGRKNLVADYVAYDANDYDEDGEITWAA